VKIQLSKDELSIDVTGDKKTAKKIRALVHDEVVPPVKHGKSI
jgi:hypothetical protein